MNTRYASTKLLYMQRIFARPIRDIFRPRLIDELELIAELHYMEDWYMPDAHIVLETKSRTYFMHRGGGVLLDLPQDETIAALHNAGLMLGEDPSQRVKRELADLLKNWRRCAGLTTKEAGALLGISPRTLEGIEQGRGFRFPTLLVLALMQTMKDVTKDHD